MKLKHKTNIIVAETRERGVVECRQICIFYRYRAGVGVLKAAEDVEKCGFSRATRTHNRHYLTARYRQIDSA